MNCELRASSRWLPAAIREAPPALGADTEQILAQRLGYTAERIERLKCQGII